jgi:hypothetical protein
MKSSFLLIAVLAIAVTGLVITNPGPEEYTRYATRQVGNYLTVEVCTELPTGLGGLLAEQCPEMVRSALPQLEAIVRDRTQRLNFGVASLYRTTFGIPEFPMLPNYQAETVGVVKQFITYRLAKVS